MKKKKIMGIIGLLVFACGLIFAIYYGWQIAAYGWSNPDLTDRRILRDMTKEYILFFLSIVCSYGGIQIFIKEG